MNDQNTCTCTCCSNHYPILHAITRIHVFRKQWKEEWCFHTCLHQKKKNCGNQHSLYPYYMLCVSVVWLPLALMASCKQCQLWWINVNIVISYGVSKYAVKVIFSCGSSILWVACTGVWGIVPDHHTVSLHTKNTNKSKKSFM